MVPGRESPRFLFSLFHLAVTDSTVKFSPFIVFVLICPSRIPARLGSKLTTSPHYSTRIWRLSEFFLGSSCSCFVHTVRFPLQAFRVGPVKCEPFLSTTLSLGAPAPCIRIASFLEYGPPSLVPKHPPKSPPFPWLGFVAAHPATVITCPPFCPQNHPHTPFILGRETPIRAAGSFSLAKKQCQYGTRKRKSSLAPRYFACPYVVCLPGMLLPFFSQFFPLLASSGAHSFSSSPSNRRAVFPPLLPAILGTAGWLRLLFFLVPSCPCFLSDNEKRQARI